MWAARHGAEVVDERKEHENVTIVPNYLAFINVSLHLRVHTASFPHFETFGLLFDYTDQNCSNLILCAKDDVLRTAPCLFRAAQRGNEILRDRSRKRISPLPTKTLVLKLS
jgi:hypothetical protein